MSRLGTGACATRKAECPPQLALCSSLALCLNACWCMQPSGVVEGQGWQAFKNDATEIIPELGEYPSLCRAEQQDHEPGRRRRETHHPFETKGM